MYKNKKWLEEQYKIKTIGQIANECNISPSTISRWLKKFNINIRNGNDAHYNNICNQKEKSYANKKWLEEQYKTKSVEQIALSCGITKQALLKWFKKFDIPRRDANDRMYRTNGYNERYFQYIDSHNKAYWLGFIMADGCITGGKIFSLSISNKDLQHLETFANDIAFKNKIVIINRESGFQLCQVRLMCQDFYDDLVLHGISENKTGNECFPEINEEYYSDFIRGFFDGDGCFTYHKIKNHINGSFKIAIGSLALLESIKTVLIDYASIEENSIKIYDCSHKYNIPFYSLEITRNKELIKLFNYLYQDTADRFLQRKKDKFLYVLDYLKSTGNYMI